MKIIGLDIAQKTGYSVLDNGKLIEYGLFTVKLTQNPDKDKLEFKKFRKFILDLLFQHSPDFIVFEYIFMGRDPKVVGNLNQLRGIATECIPIDITIGTDHLARMRKIVLGQGKRHDKKDVFKYITQKYNLLDLKFYKDNDKTDAIFLALWGFLTKASIENT